MYGDGRKAKDFRVSSDVIISAVSEDRPMVSITGAELRVHSVLHHSLQGFSPV
jgi:hypothetical protein